MAGVTPSRDAAELLRRALLALAGASVVATALELAMTRHWDSAEQLIPWVALGAVTVLGLVRVLAPTTVRFVRWASVAVGLVGLYGVLEHVAANHDAGPLDFRYADKWDAMSSTSQWWAAATKSVGPTPPLAPMALTLAALLIALSTIGLACRPRSAQAG